MYLCNKLLPRQQSVLTLIRMFAFAQSKEAGEVLQAYYQAQRRCGQRSESRTTIRMLESLVRLAQAHARLCMCDTVSVRDAVVVVNIMATSMDGADGESEPWARTCQGRIYTLTKAQRINSHSPGASFDAVRCSCCAGEAGEDTVLRDFDNEPDACYAKTEQRVLAGLGLQPSVLAARPTQRCDRHSLSNNDADPTSHDALRPGARLGPGRRKDLSSQGQPSTGTDTTPSTAGIGDFTSIAGQLPPPAQQSVPFVHDGPPRVAATNTAAVGRNDDDDEVDSLSFGDEQASGNAAVASSTTATSSARAIAASSNSIAAAAAAALAECHPNSGGPARRAQGRVGKRKADEAVSRGLQAFRSLSAEAAAPQRYSQQQHYSQPQSMASDLDDNEADALDL
jgi:hypothetical protein